MLFLCNPFITSGQALIAGTGTFTVLGQEALFNTSILQVSEAGSFALSGQAADFRRNLIFEAAAGAIALDGQIVTMIYGKGLLAEVGAFTITGNEAAVLRALLLEAGTGSFTVTGKDADFVRHLALAAEPGLFSLSGQAADFRAGVNLGAEAGLFTLTGQEASIARGAVLQASAGAYALNGQGVTLRRALRLEASMGSFALTGQDAALTYVSQATIDYIGSTPDTVDRTTYTFTDHAIGGPGLIVIVAYGEGGARDIVSATIGGALATTVRLENGLSNQCIGIFQQRIASGTTSTVTVTFSGTMSRAAIAVFRVQGTNSDTPHHINSNTAGAATSVGTTLDGLSGGVAVAGMVSNNDDRITWTGITERYDAGIEASTGGSGGDWAFSAEETARSISVSGPSDARAIVAASWR